jgi:CelD/BcsL family acetyltransferase involved in cellulose biosynthesis
MSLSTKMPELAQLAPGPSAIPPGIVPGAVASEWLERADGLDLLREAWNPLLARSRANRVFLTWEWVSTWWRHFGGGRSLRLLLLRDAAGVLRGIAPLYLETRWSPLGPVRKIQFLGFGGEANPDYLNFVFEAGWEAPCVSATLDALLARRGEWDLVKLTDLCEDAPEATLLAAGTTARRLRIHRFQDTSCPYFPLPGTFAELLSVIRPNLRRDIRKSTKILGEMAGEVVSCSTPDGVEEGLGSLARLHQLRMEDSERGGNFRRDSYLEFHREIMTRFSRLGWLDLRVLRLNGQDAAANYAFRYDGVFYGYQMGLHPEFYRLSLGTVLLARMIEDAIKEGFREVDLLRGRSHWKYRWTGRERRNLTFIIEARGLAGRRGHLGDLAANPTGVMLKRVLPARAFSAIQHAKRRVKAWRNDGKAP